MKRLAKTGKRYASVLAVVLFTAAISLIAPPAHAQVSVSDASQEASNIKQLSNMIQQLNQWVNMVKQYTNILDINQDISNAVGLVGGNLNSISGGSISQVISLVHMGYSLDQNGRNLISNIVNLANTPIGKINLLSLLQSTVLNSSYPITTQNALAQEQVSTINSALQGGNPLSQTISMLQKSLYTQSTTPDASQIQSTNIAREAMLQQATLTSMAAASAAQTSMNNEGNDSLTQLTSASSGATNTRGDIQAGNAITIKMVEQLQASNHILSQLLYLESVNSVSAQGLTGANATNTLITQ